MQSCLLLVGPILGRFLPSPSSVLTHRQGSHTSSTRTLPALLCWPSKPTRPPSAPAVPRAVCISGAALSMVLSAFITAYFLASVVGYFFANRGDGSVFLGVMEQFAMWMFTGEAPGLASALRGLLALTAVLAGCQVAAVVVLGFLAYLLMSAAAAGEFGACAARYFCLCTQAHPP
jgi:hypothetical protein